jgi:periplasmic protein TonB
MLAYAANDPQVAVRRPSPKTLLLVILAHVAAVALIISAKNQLQQRPVNPPIIVKLIQQPPPPPNVVKPRIAPQHPLSTVPQPPPPIAMPQLPTAQPTPPLPNFGNLIGPSVQRPPQPNPQPIVPTPASTAPRLLTPLSELKPPYPESKLLTGEEASLRLRLTIDDQGRVVSVDPVGPADRTFLDTARRYLMTHWRYKPATQAGQPVATSIVITLVFLLDG